MSKIKTLWNAPQPETYRRVLFVYDEGRNWRFFENWKFNLTTNKNLKFWHWNIITPVLRFTKCNGKIEAGIGNHYFIFGW